MRLDHLLSREKAGRETGRLIPRSIVASQGAMEKKGPKGPKVDSVLPVHSVSFSGFVQKVDWDCRGGLAQLGEHLLCTQGVSGSIPLISTIWVDSSVG